MQVRGPPVGRHMGLAGGTGKKAWLPGHGHLGPVLPLCPGRCPWRGRGLRSRTVGEAARTAGRCGFSALWHWARQRRPADPGRTDLSQDLHSAHSRDASVSCELGVRHSWEDGPRRTDGNASAPGPAFSRPRRRKQNREARPAVSLVDVGAAGRGTQSRRSLQPAAAEATGQCGLCPQSDGLMVTGKGQVRLRPPGQAAEWPYPSCTCSKTSCLT